MKKFKEIKRGKELDLYDIEMDENGNKQIHILAYTYYGDQWAFVELTWFIEPLDEFVEHVKEDKYYVVQQMSEYKQYQSDCTSKEIVDIINHYFDGESADYILPYTEITTDTPCGCYVAKS